jgi:hypothetical protein
MCYVKATLCILLLLAHKLLALVAYHLCYSRQCTVPHITDHMGYIESNPATISADSRFNLELDESLHSMDIHFIYAAMALVQSPLQYAQPSGSREAYMCGLLRSAVDSSPNRTHIYSRSECGPFL